MVFKEYSVQQGTQLIPIQKAIKYMTKLIYAWFSKSNVSLSEYDSYQRYQANYVIYACMIQWQKKNELLSMISVKDQNQEKVEK